MHQGNLDKALVDYDGALKLDPQFAEARFRRALTYFAKNDADKALADYRGAGPARSENARRVQKLGRCGKNQASRAAAVDQFEKSLQQARPDAQIRFLQGNALHKAGEFDRAVAEYDKAIEIYPRYIEAYYNRGLAYRKQNNPARAIRDYTWAIRLDPKYIPAYANRGYIYFTQSEWDRATADFKKILELDPDNADAQKSLDTIEKMRHKGEEDGRTDGRTDGRRGQE